MMRILGVAALGLAFGAVLALPGIAWPVRPGWIGATLLVLIALAVRRHWARRGAVGADPGARERRAWHALAGLAVIAGHLMASLARDVDLHVGAGNTLAIDNWTLIAGAALAWLIVRAPKMEWDERDREIANRGLRVGHWVMTGLLILLLLTLGFAPEPVVDRLQPFVLGNVMVVVILLSALASQAAQLIGYWAASDPGSDADG